MAQDTREVIHQWAQEIGEKAAISRLAKHMSPTAAERLCKGTYSHEPKALRSIISQILSEDGFRLPGRESA